MKKVLYLFILVMLLSGCATVVPTYNPLTETGKPEIAVCVFDTRDAEGGYKGNTDFGKMMAEFTAGILQQSNYKAIVIPIDSDTSKFAYVIKGKFSQIEVGNWGKRFWVGMGAGSVRMTVLIKVIRVSDKVELLKYKFSNTCTWISGQESSLQKITVNLANETAERFIKTINQKQNQKEDW